VKTRKLTKIKEGVELYENFTGHQAEKAFKVPKPKIPDVMVAIGEVTGIMYSTIRDGKLEQYIHEFKKGSRPLFAVSHDGKSLVLLGGAFRFTERGIEDRRS